jgi:hypothetical protein
MAQSARRRRASYNWILMGGYGSGLHGLHRAKKMGDRKAKLGKADRRRKHVHNISTSAIAGRTSCGWSRAACWRSAINPAVT